MHPISPANDAPSAAGGSEFNPIAWAQFHLRGGWRTFWMTTVGYSAVVAAGMLLIARLSDGTPQPLGGLKTAFTGLQAGLLVVFIATRVSTAIRQDQTSRMLESHRLMPISPPQAVLGYLVGSSAAPLAICGANVLLGWGLSAMVGTPLALWLTLNAVLVLFGMFTAVLAAFGTFAGRPGAMAVGWIVAFVGMINFITIGRILPAVNVLATPMLGSTVFDLSVAGRDAVAKYAPSTLFQAWIAAVCFAAACRKYRRDDRPALGWDLGLLMLAAWVATSFAGIMFWEHFEPGVIRGRDPNPAYQLLGSMIVSMLLALVPLAGSAWSSADWARRRATGPVGSMRPPPPVLVALVAAGITLLLVMASAEPYAGAAREAAVRTGVVLAAFYVATVYILRVLARVTDKVLYPMLVWLMIAWFMPLAVDYGLWWVRGEYEDSYEDPMVGPTSCFGALGALIHIWAGDSATGTTPGIVFQLVLAAAAAAAFYATDGRPVRKPAAPKG